VDTPVFFVNLYSWVRVDITNDPADSSPVSTPPASPKPPPLASPPRTRSLYPHSYSLSISFHSHSLSFLTEQPKRDRGSSNPQEPRPVASTSFSSSLIIYHSLLLLEKARNRPKPIPASAAGPSDWHDDANL
jgi:hypothetical protein